MHDTPKLTVAIIRKWLGSASTNQGRDYYKQGKVIEFGDLDDANGVYAHVEGRSGRRYSLTIHFHEDGVACACSCETASKCKHAAATLYEVMEDQRKPSESVPEVSPSFSMWLGGIAPASAVNQPSKKYSEDVKQRLLYILEPERNTRHITVRFVTTRLLKDGRYGKANDYSAVNILDGQMPQYILVTDADVLRTVAKDRSLGATALNGAYRLKGEQGLNILRKLLTSGRCHWLDKDTPALKQGEKCQASWFWECDEHGGQYLQLKMPESMEKTAFMLTSPPWYIDIKHARCGSIETGQLADVAEVLLNIPAIPLEAEKEEYDDIRAQLPDDIATPEPLQYSQRVVPPVPVVQLLSKEMMNPNSLRMEATHIVALLFDYDGHKLPYLAQDTSTFRAVSHGLVVDFQRDVKTENAAVAALLETHLYTLSDDYRRNRHAIPKHYFTLHDTNFWAEWVLHTIPRLKEKGFQVQISKDFAYRMETAETWQLDMGSNNHGHSLMGAAALSVTLDDGEEVDLIEVMGRWVAASPNLLQEASILEIKNKESVALPLADGRLLAAPGPMIGNILHYMLDVFATKKPEEAMLSAPQMLALEESLKALDTPVQVSSSTWLKHMKKLSAIETIPVASIPSTLKAELRDYQHEGLSWMQFLREMQLGGILADDMGLGKTVQALAHVLVEKAEGRLKHPVLVIAPTSLMYNWRREAEKFAEDLKVLTLHGAERAKLFAKISEYDLILTTYPLLVRDFDILAAQAWHLLILDEAQYIKNPRSKVAQQVRKLDASHKLCLTGTPMENHLGELWAQFDFLMPGYLYDQKQFMKIFRKPIEKEGDVARQEALNLRIRPFMLRRAKEEVASELPPKTEMIRSTDLNDQQREMYESVRLAMQKKVRDAVATLGMEKSQIIVLDALLKMRQVCCDPRLVKGIEGAVPASAKLEMLSEMLVEMHEEGRRILLFSQFTGMLKLIEDEVNRLGIGYVKLTGSTKDRITPVESFQEGNIPLFLISLKAGGVGLNLTAADTVIHYDPWWNPAAESQATDRAHRIGQEKSVFVYKLITEGTVEEKILELQERKRALAEGIHQKAGASTALWTNEDMNSLFAPLH
ncbi:MAG: DEAD/DEAH box helicase [Zetaproteobacteria bacterium]|nr:DEAD/DEAH box helicase [Zetaproteobacteria bacterium]